MAAKLEEITATFIGENQRWDQTVIATVELPKNPNPEPYINQSFSDLDDIVELSNRQIRIKGTAEPDELQYQLTYRFYGRWKKYTNKRTGVSEDQFEFQTFVRAQPHGMAGVVRYLQNAPHVGSATARKLWEGFQSDAVRILREQPAVAASRVGGQFTEPKAIEAAEFLKQEAALEACTLEMLDLVSGRGFPKSVARQAIRKWGNKAADILKHNPYLLMKFRGCGFLRCDAMFLDLGGEASRLKRQALCAWHALASNNEGHTWFPVTTAEQALREKISGSRVKTPEALRLAKRAKMIDVRRDDKNRLWLAESSASKAERRVAEFVASAEREAHYWPSLNSCTALSDHQRGKANYALSGTICHLGGGPGTGKTFTAAQIVKLIQSADLGGSIAVAAPTGKAAVRITEAMRNYGLDIQAQTIHSLLGVKSGGNGDGWAFRHKEETPLPQRWIIVDEASMIDVSLMACLLAARAMGTHLLLVGDVNQLPPVGHGAPLRDLIAADIPCGILTEIRRNSGRIVTTCHAIREGGSITTSQRIDLTLDDPENLFVVSARNAEQQIEKIELGIEAGRRDKLDPIWDVQVLTAVNDKSGVSRKELNKRLQVLLNRSGITAGNNPFRIGDKIVNLQNGSFPECLPDGTPKGDDFKAFIANGELAEVIAVDAGWTLARTRPGDVVIKIPRGQKSADESASGTDKGESNSGCSWDLGYALSVHKSQGSEWPIAIVVLDEYPGARMVTSREWIYTAISRAKRLCLLIGKTETANSMVRRVALSNRKTFLVERIAESRRLLTCQADILTGQDCARNDLAEVEGVELEAPMPTPVPAASTAPAKPEQNWTTDRSPALSLS